MKKPRIAIVLFNLGGPDRMESVKPFLVNLFTDPAILRVPFFVRPLLARVIARARTPAASANYALLGGASPLLELTREQADALSEALPELDARCFIAMRYWHPFSLQTAREVAAWDPDEIVLMPLYPQYSTTTTGSSLTAWREAAAKVGLVRRTTAVCCWPTDPGFVEATAAIVRRSYAEARAKLAPEVGLRVLFSAHGLPEVIVKAGDPYQLQVEQTAASVAEKLAIPALDWSICYQSRATPQKWLDPSTESAIEAAVHDKVAVLVVPIAFVSDHSETLVELDIEYAEFAAKAGIAGYFRAPAQNADAGFVRAMAGVVRGALERGPGLCSAPGRARCAAVHADCPHRRAMPKAA